MLDLADGWRLLGGELCWRIFFVDDGAAGEMRFFDVDAGGGFAQPFEELVLLGLAVDLFLAFCRIEALVGAVWLLHAGEPVVLGEDLENVKNGGLDFVIEDLDGDFDAEVEVSGHPVGAADVQMLTLAVAEEEDARMLKEAADHAFDGDVFGEAWHAGTHAADAADVKGDLHAGLAGFDELVDDVLIGEAVDLGDDARWLAGFGGCDLAIDELEEMVFHLERRDEKILALLDKLAEAEAFKDVDGFGGDVFVGGDEGKVCVLACSLFVVVAGADLHDVLDLAVDIAGDDAELGMDFVLVEAVDDLTACFLEALGPDDIVLFVKAGFELDEDHDVLAVLGCLGERLRNLAAVGDAVEGDVDGFYGWIDGCFVEKIEEGLHGMVRIGEQDVAVAAVEIANDRIPWRDARWHKRWHRLVVESWEIVGEIAEEAVDKVQRQRQLWRDDDALLLGLDAFQKIAQKLWRDLLGKLHAHNGRMLARFDQLLHLLAPVHLFVVARFVDAQVAVAREAEDEFVGDVAL